MIPSIEGRLTPLGTLATEVREDGHVVVRLRPREGVTVRHGTFVEGGVVVTDIWEGRTPPRLHDEVTLDGTTGEVEAVHGDPDGSVWVVMDGVKHRWE